MKKNLLVSIIALGAAVCFTGCSDDEKATSIAGTWDVTDAAGVEWEENAGNTGAGTIINTNDPDPEFIGETFTATADEITIGTLGTFGYELANGVLSIDLGGDTEYFNVEFDGANTMLWTQDAPTAHADYEENNPGQFLYYQKTFTLERQ